MQSFEQFVLQENYKMLGKVKIPRLDMSSKMKNAKGSHLMKMSRGMNRRNLRQVPDVHSHSKKFKDISMFMKGLDVSNKMVDLAKKASSGVWRISKAQVLDIARKYKFNVPDDGKPMKHLGSTGIQMVRYKPNVYYLYKSRKRKRKKTIKGVKKMMSPMGFSGL